MLAQADFHVVGVRTEAGETPALVRQAFLLQTRSKRLLDFPLACCGLDPGIAAVAKLGHRIAVNLGKRRRESRGKASRDFSPSYHHARPSSRQGFVVAFQKLPGVSPASQDPVSALERPFEVEGLAVVATPDRKHRAIERATPFGGWRLDQAKIVGSENHDCSAIKSIRVSPHGLPIQRRALLSHRDLRTQRSLQPAQMQGDLDLRLGCPPTNQLRAAAGSKGAKTNREIGCLQKVALPLTIRSRKHGRVRTKQQAYLFEVSPVSDP
jgi:hypothetical protein